MTDYTSIAAARHQHELDRAATIEALTHDIRKTLTFDEFAMEIMIDATFNLEIEKAYRGIFEGADGSAHSRLVAQFVDQWLWHKAKEMAEGEYA